jgi:hypothetical protein
MGRTTAITGRVVERAAGLIATPWAAIICAILLLDRIFDVVPAAAVPAGATVQRLGGAPAGRSHSLESDTAGAQSVTPATPNPEPVVVDARRVEGEGNPVIRPAHKPPAPVHDAAQRSDGVYADVNQAGEQGRSRGPGAGDGNGPRYESDYRPRRVETSTIGVIRVQHRERSGVVE